MRSATWALWHARMVDRHMPVAGLCIPRNDIGKGVHASASKPHQHLALQLMNSACWHQHIVCTSVFSTLDLSQAGVLLWLLVCYAPRAGHLQNKHSGPVVHRAHNRKVCAHMASLCLHVR